jgi:hypothetical protein
MTMDPQQRDNLDTFVCEVLRLLKDDQYVLPMYQRTMPLTIELRIYMEVRIEKKAA